MDQFGNVCNKETLRILLTKRDGHLFGDEDDTVSYVIGRNKYKKKLTWFGRRIEAILNKCEKDHCTVAINKKIDRDKEASLRAATENYFE